MVKLKKVIMKKKQTLIKIYLTEIPDYIQHRADTNSFGKVIAIGDGVARVFGLSDVQAGETTFLVKMLCF